MMVEVSDFGTNEMKNHCRMKMEPRGVSDGGNVISMGYRNQTPDTLEILYVEGYLKRWWEPESAADRRVSDGRALQELYSVFRSKGKDMEACQIVYSIMPTLEGHIGGIRDVSETVYLHTLRGLGKMSEAVRGVCIEGKLPHDLRNLLIGLDRLPKVMESVEGELKDRLKQI